MYLEKKHMSNIILSVLYRDFAFNTGHIQFYKGYLLSVRIYAGTYQLV